MKKAVELVIRAHDTLTVFGYYCSCVALAVIFVSYIAEVFGRYFFQCAAMVGERSRLIFSLRRGFHDDALRYLEKRPRRGGFNF